MAPKIKYPIIDGLKECGECHRWLRIEEYNKARNHYTSKCNECIKKYAAEYRQRPEVKKHSRIYHQEYIKDPIKRENKNAYLREYRKQPQVRDKINKARRKWTSAEKQKAIDYKGGNCMICGYSKCTAALDFHHVEPSLKDGYGAGALRAHWTFEKNKTELDKCVLLCVRCHRELHSGVISL